MLLELDAATITVDPDQRRMRQALGRLRAAVHDATTDPTREAHPAKDRPNRPNTRNPIRHVVRRCPSQASDGASAAHWGDAAGPPKTAVTSSCLHSRRCDRAGSRQTGAAP